MMRTPLSKVRGHGSANTGTDHFWQQRVTAIANLVLGIFFVALVVNLAGGSHTEVRAALASPLVAVPLLLMIVSGMIHMRLGMQVVIEDYIHGEGLKIALLLANTFFAITVGLLSAFAVLKLSLGA